MPIALLKLQLADAEFIALMRKVVDSVVRGETAEAFADSIGCVNGVGGYGHHATTNAARSRNMSATLSAATGTLIRKP